jgi:hypothetical protein
MKRMRELNREMQRRRRAIVVPFNSPKISTLAGRNIMVHKDSLAFSPPLSDPTFLSTASPLNKN